MTRQRRSSWLILIVQCSLAHQLLPASEQTKPDEVCGIRQTMKTSADIEQDVPYLSPIIQEIEAEMKERADLESMTVQKRQ